MRIQRDRSRLTFRKRRRSGCLSWAVFIGFLLSAVTLSWNWIGQRLQQAANSGDNTTSLRSAQDAFTQGDLNGTIDLTRAILAQEPDNVDALALLIRALIYRSYSDYNHATDRQSALQITSTALLKKPADPEVLALYAYALQAVGEADKAARTARQVLEKQPNHPLARVALALAYGSVGSFDIALSESLHAAETAREARSPWLLDSERALAISYSDNGNYTGAARAIDRALALNNRLLPLYFEQALYALQTSDTDTATVAYFKILAYDPNNVKARLRLCELSSMLRERETAIRYCGEVTKLAPGWSEGWYHLGREYFLQGDFAIAQKNFHSCTSLQLIQNIPPDQRRFECWYLQGQAAEILGDCESLVATYNEFLVMAANPAVRQTWTYPPEGPPGCASLTQATTPP